MGLEQAARQALEALVKSTGELHRFLTSPTDMQLITNHKAITAMQEALAEPQITTPDVCGEVCARAKLCYGCNKDLEEANAKFAEQVEREQVRKRCKRCNDTGLVSDGEIDNIGGEQLEVPIECVKDCPDCAAPVEPVKKEHSGEANEMVREPVAILKSSKANFERQFGKQVFADWIYYDLTYSFENAAPVQQAEQEPVAEVVLRNQTIGFGRTEERKDIKFLADVEVGTKLYAAPVRTKDLTVSELDAIIEKHYDDEMDLKAMILDGIAADREKNR